MAEEDTLSAPLNPPEDPSATPSLVDRLLANYQPEQFAEWTDPLPPHQTFKFKVWASVSEYQTFLVRAGAWYQGLPKEGDPGLEIHPFAGYLPHDWNEAYKAFLIHECAVDPPFEQLDALKLLRCVHMVREWIDVIETAGKVMSSVRRAAVLGEFLKNYDPTLGDVSS